MTDNRTGTTRRDFVLAGSATMLLIAGRSMAAEVMQVIPGVKQGAMPILSVGYWDGLLRGERDQPASARIVRAAGGAADSRFSRAAAMVTVYGFWRAPQNRSKPVSLSLIALYPLVDSATGHKTPFVAWNAALTSNGVTGPLRSRFVVPVDARNQMQVAVEKRTPPAATTASDLDRIRAVVADPSAVLTFGPSDAPIALRRGFYVAALREGDIEEVPDWSRIQVAQLRSTDRVSPDGDGILQGADGKPVSFDYIVFLVEPYGVSDGRDPATTDRRN